MYMSRFLLWVKLQFKFLIFLTGLIILLIIFILVILFILLVSLGEHYGPSAPDVPGASLYAVSGTGPAEFLHATKGNNIFVLQLYLVLFLLYPI